MTYYGGKNLAFSFRQVRNNTIQIAEEIPEASYSFKGAPDTRSVGQLLAHIALGARIQMHIHGSNVTDLKAVNFLDLFQQSMAEEAMPRTKAETIALLKGEGETVATFLERLSDDFLAQPVTQPPGTQPATKTRFEMLMSMKEHEMHHRGQLMLLQRMLGIVPHLTRQMQERMAQRAAAAAPATAQA
jgi:uncharacterized damage-inducible protein DinB